MKKQAKDRPDIFLHHDYKSFLVKWLAYVKVSQPHFSLRSLARAAGASVAYFSMIFSGKRKLPPSVAELIGLHTGLTASETSFLKYLCVLSDSENQNERLMALKKLQKFSEYRIKNSNELEAYRYLTKWYYVAIREMTALKNFKWEAKWIRSRLAADVSLQEVRAAMDFLISNGLVKINGKGQVVRPDKTIRAEDGVYKISLADFHKQMLGKATDSIFTVERERRRILGDTIALSKENVVEVHRILEQALEQVHKVANNTKAGDDVYHIGFLSFPVTNEKGE